MNDKIFIKDPESSDLGRNIISGSIDLIEELGFDAFTFRKLGSRIQSPEASVYRYFENKHKLLLYLTAWYWGWMEYQLVFVTANIPSAEDRLNRAIELLTGKNLPSQSFPHMDVERLNSIVISESSKAYLTREVDQENKDGIFIGYKRLVSRVSDIIIEINPGYKYPHMLISTVIEGAHHQRYFAEHLPRLTDVVKGEDSICEFYRDMVFRSIN